MVEKKNALDPDRPITSKNQDRFSRAKFAKIVADQLITTPKYESFVIGLLGPWGSGKTSILNMVEEALASEKSVKVFKFNPWFFSNTEDLLSIFFRELINQIGQSDESKLKEVGEALEKYCGMLAPIKYIPLFGEVAGQALEAGKQVGEFIGWKAGKQQGKGIQEAKKNVESLLQDISERIIVFVDDLDRLNPSEVKEIMRLIRLIGDFPNITYVLAYDQSILKKYLTDNEIDGYDFLEKIIQISYHVPILGEFDLNKFLAAELNKVLESFPDLEINQQDLTDIYHIGIKGLFRSPRDVRRYINVLPAAFKNLENEIAAVDILALEAIRVLLPELYIQLAKNRDILILSKERVFSTDDSQKKERFFQLVSLAKDRKEVIQTLFELIFPLTKKFTTNLSFGGSWTKTWRVNRRVAHAEVFSYYLEKSLPDGVLPTTIVREVLASLGNKESLEKIFNELSGEEIEHLFDRLGDYDNKLKLKPSEVIVAIQVIFNHADKLREDRRGLYDFGAEIALGSFNLRLLEFLDEGERLEVIEKILLQIKKLTWKWDLIGLVGHIDGLGHKLINKEASERLEKKLVDEIVSSPIAILKEERNLVQILRLVHISNYPEKENFRSKFDDSDLFLTLLEKMLLVSKSQSMGRVAVKVTEYLPWRWLNELLGIDRIERLVDSLVPSPEFTERQNRALELAKGYLSGALKVYDPEIHLRDPNEENT